LEDVGAAQLEWTCQHTKADIATVQLCIKRWIEEDPLLVLRRYMYSDLPDFLHACRQRGMRLGLFSDYPAEAKLAALGLVDVFDVVLTAQSPDVGALKPSPKGLRVVAERLAVRPEQCAYVGDRPEVDVAAARAAGMQCFILGSLADAAASWTGFSHYSELRERLLSVDHIGGVAQPSLDPR